MPGPWEDYGAPPPAATPPDAPWTQYQAKPSVSAPKPWSGSVLPVSRDTQGNLQFDADAGVLGALKRAFTLPSEVYQGAVDPLSPEGMDRAIEMGTVVTPGSPAVRVGEKAILGTRQAKPPTPTADELKAAAEKGYDTVRNMGVDYKADAVAEMARNLKSSLEQDGILAELAPNTHTFLDKLASPPEGSVANVSGLEAARRAFGKVGQNFNNPTDQLAAGRAQRGLEEFIETANPEAVAAGSGEGVAKALSEARGNYAAYKRSDKLDDTAWRADLAASSANSGTNLDNAIRQRVKSILFSDKQSSGFTPEELDILERIVRGSAPANTARKIGNLLGGGGGLGSVVAGGVSGGAVGGASGSPLIGALTGVGVPATGMASRALANSLTDRALTKAAETTRQRSPLYRQRQDAAPVVAPMSKATEALLRATLSSPYGWEPNGQ